MERSRELATLKTFEQHWQETLQRRKSTLSRTAVALPLEKFLDSLYFPRTGGELPHLLRRAAKKRDFRCVATIPRMAATPRCILFPELPFHE